MYFFYTNCWILTWGEFYLLFKHVSFVSQDSSDNSDSDEMTTIHDFHDEEGSSSRALAHFVSRSSHSDGVRRIAQPESSKCDQMVQTNFEKPLDCDEYYFMNLVKVFKRLSPNKKTEVRMKIERILFEAELE